MILEEKDINVFKFMEIKRNQKELKLWIYLDFNVFK